MKSKTPKQNRSRKSSNKKNTGSVLILVIALLVLLALIGTAFLSTTQTERYASDQNSINTEADLLITGLQDIATSNITSALFSNGQYRPPKQEMPTWTNDSSPTPPPTVPATPSPGTYYHYNSTQSDVFLGDRLPTNNGLTTSPYASPAWNAISWPLFPDGSGNYTFDSPFATSISMNLAQNKSQVQAYPGSTTVNGILYPAMAYFIPMTRASDGSYSAILQTASGPVKVTPPASTPPYPGVYITNNGSVNPTTSAATVGYQVDSSPGYYASLQQPIPSAYLNFAASAAGDGISDGGMFKLPVGPVNGITYYASWRVIDNNSAVNVSTAWSATSDPAVGAVSDVTMSPTPSNRLYGFFRSNVGLRELLQNTTEMDALNAYRFNGVLPGTTSTPGINSQPLEDEIANTVPFPFPRSDLSWYSAGDAVEHQMISRWANPGYNTSGQRFNWMGTSQSAALAYKFSLTNSNAGQSLIEQMLPSETTNFGSASTGVLQSTPYAPSQVSTWYSSLFSYTPAFVSSGLILAAPSPPLRPILTGSNELSNNIPSRLGYTSSPTTYNPATPYDFGDWVTYQGFSYVCLLHNVGQTPILPSSPPSATGPEYWTQVPWTNQPVKTSINTATFDQLWLGFAQAMTDSVSAVNTVSGNKIPLWQPPMMTQTQATGYNEKQQQMFRSSIRDNRSLPISNALNTGNPTKAVRVQLTPMQQLQLRAALAAINTLTMRNAPFNNATTATSIVRSHHITLADNSGNPTYDAEVFGTAIQPYIGQVYTRHDSKGGPLAFNFIAIQLLNPYPFKITIDGSWGFGMMSRANYQSTPSLTMTPLVSAVTPITIPAATTTAGPGSVTIYDFSPGNSPDKFISALTGGAREQGLVNAIGNELVIMMPRMQSMIAGALTGTLSNQTSAGDTYNEGVKGAVNLYDMVPADQIDLTGTDQPPKNQSGGPQFCLYRRAADSPTQKGTNGATYAWNFTWPGFYTPYNNSATPVGNTSTPPSNPSYAPAQQPAVGTIAYPYSQAIINLPTEPDLGSLAAQFNQVPSGPVDSTGSNPSPGPTYNTITMQLNNVGFPGTKPILGATGSVNQFPFGGFARNIDILQVPYIGAYRISAVGIAPSAGFYEMNSVTMDSSMANDQTIQPSYANPAAAYSTTFPALKILPTPSGFTISSLNITADSMTDPFVEQIGRFCPIGDPNGPTPSAQMDFGQGYDVGGDSRYKNYWHYHWTRRVLDYFTVQAPHDDYFPNVDPTPPGTGAATDVQPTPIPPKYLPWLADPTKGVYPVNNSSNTPASAISYYANALVATKSEDSSNAGVEGLININTAPWPVLATLPFVPRGTDLISYNSSTGVLMPTWSMPMQANTLVKQPNQTDDNVDLAKAIVDYRNQNGPFKSIMDLYKVPAFRLEGILLMNYGDPGIANLAFPLYNGSFVPLGDFSGTIDPNTGNLTGTDGVRFDFEEKFLLLNNVSNLITTRSDSFTVYLLLQGWRNAGTGNPTLAVQRRAAFILDRNPITPASPTLTAAPQTIPSD